MTATIGDLMLANLFEVFNERDRELRTIAIARTYIDNVVFSDHDGIATGREALNEKAQKFLEKAPQRCPESLSPQVWREQDDRYIFRKGSRPGLQMAQGFLTLL
jgi:hypothetical protein